MKHEFNVYVWKHNLSFTSKYQERTSSALKENKMHLFPSNFYMFRITIFNSIQYQSGQNFICRTKTEHTQWSALYFFCHSCVFARLYVAFLIENVLYIFVSFRPINQTLIFLSRNDVIKSDTF